jgi:cytochrome c
MIRIKYKPVLIMTALMALSPAAFALDGAELYKTKTCFTCHGKDGNTTIMPSYPKVAGQNEAYALQQMKDIKSGARANGMSAAMKGIMHLVSDEEMEALAKYLSTMQP